MREKKWAGVNLKGSCIACRVEWLGLTVLSNPRLLQVCPPAVQVLKGDSDLYFHML